MNTWVISDTHFGHRNIIDYCHRPFYNVAEMDRIMTQRWQERVRRHDLIYHLGDVMLTARRTDEEIRQFMDNLPGTKILILGNHDKSAKRMMELGFNYACESIILDVEGVPGNPRVLLNHYPVREMPKDVSRDGPAPYYCLHGHIHNSTAKERLPHATKGELVDIPWFNINCSVEVQNYEPMTIQTVIRRHAERLINRNDFNQDPMRKLQD